MPEPEVFSEPGQQFTFTLNTVSMPLLKMSLIPLNTL